MLIDKRFLVWPTVGHLLQAQCKNGRTTEITYSETTAETEKDIKSIGCESLKTDEKGHVDLLMKEAHYPLIHRL